MRYSDLSRRISGEGAEAWQTHAAGIRARQQGNEVYLLSVGDPDFDTPRHVIDAAVEGLTTGDTHYTDINGREPLRAAIAERTNARTGCEFSAANVTLTVGCQNALFSTAALLLEPGDE
ncbi:MAG: aminotransferase class I/II-fold pyridoxal phosphate-dependent enzyme, partial [Granulosicoccaceae bacterium]